MKKLYIEEFRGESIVLIGDSHYHIRSLRKKTGDLIDVVCGDGLVYRCRIDATDAKSTRLIPEQTSKDDSEQPISVSLFFGVQKGAHMEITVQKCTELGVFQFVPFLSDHTVKEKINTSRLRKIALEAVQQCGGNRLPQFMSVQSFVDIIGMLEKFDLVVFPFERAEGMTVKKLLQKEDKQKVERVAVVVGSEGGFSQSEAVQLSKLAQPVSLGKRILRADTAAIVTCGLVMSEFGE
jgi:16S rRNA (uracil1498-N3)-methyltransferase